MKKVKSIFKKALALMGENEVRAWGIGIEEVERDHQSRSQRYGK